MSRGLAPRPLKRVLVLGALVAGFGLGSPSDAQAAPQGFWCGAAVSASDRKPDWVSGAQWHLIYASPSDGVDRSAEWIPRIVTDMETVYHWWGTQDPARRPRFDLHQFGCDSYFGQLDISVVRLPQLGLFYANSTGIFAALVGDLAAAGHDDAAKKYIIYYDGPIVFGTAPVFCGHGGVGYSLTGGINASAILYLQSSSCPFTTDVYRQNVAAHEIVHALNAPVPAAPHYCAGHVCDDVSDIMNILRNRLNGISTMVLDYGHDDYYGHEGSWWDTQDSPFLLRLDVVTLRVSLGFGEGTINSSPAGIACPGACTAEFTKGATVQLTAAPAQYQRLTGWSGVCSGAGATCTVKLDADATVAVTFATQRYVVSVTRSGAGGGSVTSSPSGIACGVICETEFDGGSIVELAAEPSEGSVFDGWSGGACSGASTCAITVSEAASVTASFSIRMLTLSLAVRGSGAVKVPGRRDCRSSCRVAVPWAEQVSLRAVPKSGWRFAGWRGGCSGMKASCRLAPRSDLAIRAVFQRR